MVRAARRAGQARRPEHEPEDEREPGERRVRARARPCCGSLPAELADRPVADRGAQQLARAPELVLPRDRPEPRRERRRRLVRPVLGLGLPVAVDPLARVPELDDDEPAARGPAPRERRALAVGQDDADAPLEPRREEAVRRRARRGRRSSWRRERPAAAAATRSRPPPAAVEANARGSSVGKRYGSARSVSPARPAGTCGIAARSSSAASRARSSLVAPSGPDEASIERETSRTKSAWTSVRASRLSSRRSTGCAAASPNAQQAAARSSARPRSAPASREPDRGRRPRGARCGRAPARRAGAPPRGTRARRAG